MAGSSHDAGLAQLHRVGGYDPRPARWPGAAPTAHPYHTSRCSIRSAPGCDPRPARWPGAAHRVLRVHGKGDTVAILARRDGRAQQLLLHPAVHGGPALRSSPGAMAGRSLVSDGARVGRPLVAILARRDGRAQPGWHSPTVTV